MEHESSNIEIPSQSKILEALNQDVDVYHQDAKVLLRNVRMKNINNIVIAYLNVNSYSNKHDSVKAHVPGSIDIMIIGESKLDDSCRTSRFNIEGIHEPFRLNRNKNDLISKLNADTASKTDFKIPKNISLGT